MTSSFRGLDIDSFDIVSTGNSRLKGMGVRGEDTWFDPSKFYHTYHTKDRLNDHARNTVVWLFVVSASSLGAE